MTLLVSLAKAKDHLRIDGSDGDEDLALKIAEAQDIILGYLKRDSADTGAWAADTVPARVVAAILLVLTDLNDNRDGEGGDYLSDGGPVARLLHRDRDPALA